MVRNFGIAALSTCAVATLILGKLSSADDTARSSAGQSAGQSVRATYGDWHASRFGGGGYVQNIVFCPSDANRLYAYVDTCGVYRSDNNGKRWRMVFGMLPEIRVRSVAVDPRDANRLVAAVGDTGQGLFESRNGGEIWTPVLRAAFYANGPRRSDGVVLARDPQNPDVLLAAASGDGVFRSTDGGTHWTPVSGAGGLYPTDLKWSRNGADIFLCAQQTTVKGKSFSGGFYVSHDKGLTWSKRSDTAPTEMAEDAETNGRWYGLMVDTARRVALSSDGGLTWNDYSQGLPPYLAKGSESTNDTVFHALGVGPGFALIDSARGTVYRRGAQDSSWKAVVPESVTENYEGRPWWGRKMPGVFQHYGAAAGSILVDPSDPARWFSTDWFGVYVSPDAGRHWQLSMDGMENTVMTALAQDPASPNTMHLGMADNGYLLSSDQGEWFVKPRVASTIRSLVVAPSRPARIYAAGNDKGVRHSDTLMVSDDSGKSWRKPTPIGLPDTNTYRLSDLAVDPTDANRVSAALSGPVEPNGGGVYRSVDGGAHWAWHGDGLPIGARFFYDDVWGGKHELAASPNGSLIAFSTETKQLFRLPVGANRWLPIALPTQPEGAVNPSDLCADKRASGAGFLLAGLGSGGGIFCTKDSGLSWTRLLQGATSHITQDARFPQQMAASDANGVLLSTDGGKNWGRMDSHLPAPRNPILAFAGNRLIAATNGAGAFWIALPDRSDRIIPAPK